MYFSIALFTESDRSFFIIRSTRFSIPLVRKLFAALSMTKASISAFKLASLSMMSFTSFSLRFNVNVLIHFS